MKKLNAKQAAEYLTRQGYTIGLGGLQARRAKKQPPRFVYAGKKPLYDTQALDEFLGGKDENNKLERKKSEDDDKQNPSGTASLD